MIYNVTFSVDAEKDIIKLKSNEPQVYKKLMKLLIELQEHPFTGTGHPKPLSGNRVG